jgi:hypothetical protein
LKVAKATIQNAVDMNKNTTGGGGDERCERQAAVGAEVAWRDAGGGGEQRKGDGGVELVRWRERDVGLGHGEGAEGHGGGDGKGREGHCTGSRCGREERKGKERRKKTLVTEKQRKM